MEKLIYQYHQTDDCTYSYDVFYPFQYSSIDNFLEDFIEELTNFKYEEKLKFPLIMKFDLEYYVKDALKQDPIDNTYTLQEWFHLNEYKF